MHRKTEELDRLDPASVDVVVMCNVLHELDPRQWLDWFGHGGRLTRLLKTSGKLLLVEDYGIPVGERAHEYGFLLLDEPELRTLFEIREADVGAKRFLRSTLPEPSLKDRLVAFLIDKSCIERASAQTVHGSIDGLRNRTLRELERVLVQSVKRESKEGRAYARNAQLSGMSTAVHLDLYRDNRLGRRPRSAVLDRDAFAARRGHASWWAR